MHRFMQKIFFLIFILSVVVSFSACGETLPENSGTQNSDFVTSSSNTETDQTSDSITNTSSQTNQTSNPENTVSSTDDASDSETDQTTDSQNTDTEEVSDSQNTDTVINTSTTNRPSDTETEKVTDTTTDTSSNRPSDTETEKVTDSKDTDTATNTSTTTDTPSSSTVITDSTTDTSESVDADTKPEDTPAKPVVKTDISPIDPENYFGVQWLSTQANGSNLVKSYQELAAGIKELKEEIPLSAGITEKELHTVWYCFQADYPQYFWLGSQFEYYQKGNEITKIVPSYIVTGSELSAEQKDFDKAAKKLTAGINSSMTQYEIEKTIHDRLVLHCNYKEAKDAHNAYGALVNGTAVCEGITKAFQHLCRSVGIETLFVFGTSYNPTSGNIEGHSWNIVKIEKNYYHIDVTWDNAGEPSEDELHYAWFNLPTQWICEDHVLAQMGYAYPNCTETKENFFTKNNGRLSKLSVEEIVKRTKKHGEEYFFRAYLTDQTDPYQWMNENGATLAGKLGLNGYEYRIITVGHEVTIVMSNYKG